MLQPCAEMVGQIGPDAGQIVADCDADLLQVRCRSDAGNLQQLRGVVGAPAQHDLPVRAEFLVLAVLLVGDTDACFAVEDQRAGGGAGDDLQIGIVAHRTQIGLRRGTAEPAAPGHLRIADAFLQSAVVVVGQRETGLLGGLNETMGQRQDGAVVLHFERAAAAAILGIAALLVGFRILEMRQDFVVRPAAAAALRPTVIVGRIAAHIKHAVDRARPAEHLAAGQRDAAAGRAFHRLGLIVPVDARVLQQRPQRGGNMDAPVSVLRSGLEQRHPRAALHQAAGDGASCRSGPDDDIIRLHRAFLSRLSGQ